MNQNERTLLEGAFKTFPASVKAIILHGMLSTEQQILEALKGLVSTPVEPLSLKDAAAQADGGKLRESLKARVWTSSACPTGLQA